LVEAIRHRYRSQEESELAMHFVDEASLNRTLAEMKQLGVSNLHSYIKGMWTISFFIFQGSLHETCIIEQERLRWN